jgi:hypothetical protein
VDFATVASQKGVQQMCHIMILFQSLSRIKDEINKKYEAFCHVQKNIIFHMKGKLIKTTSVL